MPCLRNSGASSTNRVTWPVEQVGVKAPGKANRTTRRPLNRLSDVTSCTLPSRRILNVMLGIEAPSRLIGIVSLQLNQSEIRSAYRQIAGLPYAVWVLRQRGPAGE